MRHLLLSVMLFTCAVASGQNRLIELYTIEPGNHYPQNMPHVADCINTTLSPAFVRNLQSSGNIKSAAKFLSFTLAGRTAKIVLPGTKGISLNPTAGTIRVDYQQEILNYINFDITNFDYSLKGYFMLARDILHIKQEQMVANAVNIMTDFETKRSSIDRFIDAVNTRMHTKMAYPADGSFKGLMAILKQQFQDKIDDAIFTTFIEDKKDEKARAKLNQFYMPTRFFKYAVVERIDEMISPVIKWGQVKPAEIEFPSTILKLSPASGDSLVNFRFQSAKSILNYKKRQLEIVFTGQLNGKAVVKSGKLMDYNFSPDKPKLLTPTGVFAQPVELKQLWLTISESGITLEAETITETRYQLLNEKWPK